MGKDSHTYVRTPTHKQPVTDYVGVREKASSQKRDVERALTRFIAKTGKRRYVDHITVGDSLPRGITCYSIICALIGRNSQVNRLYMLPRQDTFTLQHG